MLGERRMTAKLSTLMHFHLMQMTLSVQAAASKMQEMPEYPQSIKIKPLQLITDTKG